MVKKISDKERLSCLRCEICLSHTTSSPVKLRVSRHEVTITRNLCPDCTSKAKENGFEIIQDGHPLTLHF
jgi:hypothetical protein